MQFACQSGAAQLNPPTGEGASVSIPTLPPGPILMEPIPAPTVPVSAPPVLCSPHWTLDQSLLSSYLLISIHFPLSYADHIRLLLSFSLSSITPHLRLTLVLSSADVLSPYQQIPSYPV